MHNNLLAATAIFYGSPVTDPQILKTLPGPVLGIFGGADQSIPLENVDAFEQGLQEAGISHQITIYEGQPHAFVTSIEAIRQGGVQGQAWQELLDFLKSNLKTSPSSHSGAVEATFEDTFDWGDYLRLVYEPLLERLPICTNKLTVFQAFKRKNKRAENHLSRLIYPGLRLERSP